MRVYLAGPMTGIPKMNFPAFDAAARDLRERGFDVVSPAELDDPEDRALALASEDGDITALSSGKTWGDFLARDVKLLADDGVEAVVVLRGWSGSRGARLETFVARLCGLPILCYPDLQPVDVGVIDFAHGPSFDDTPWNDEAPWSAEDHADTPAWSTGEVRITDPKTGAQKGQKLAQLGALDPLALLEVAKVAGFGAQKYDRFNYAKGYAWSLSFDALQRHLLQWAAGEEVDEESGLPHVAHAGWHCLALLTFILRERGTDDRLHRMLETT